jgi:hypothetical protein
MAFATAVTAGRSSNLADRLAAKTASRADAIPPNPGGGVADMIIGAGQMVGAAPTTTPQKAVMAAPIFCAAELGAFQPTSVLFIVASALLSEPSVQGTPTVAAVLKYSNQALAKLVIASASVLTGVIFSSCVANVAATNGIQSSMRLGF